MPWPDDLYGGQPIEQANPFAGSISPEVPPYEPWEWVPESWRTAFQPPPAPPQPDPLEFTPTAAEGLDAPPAPPPEAPDLAAPVQQPGSDAAQPPLPPGLEAVSEPPFQMPEMFGGPAPDAVSDAQGAAVPAGPPVESAAEYANPLDDPNLSQFGKAQALAEIGRTNPELYLQIKAEHDAQVRGLTADRERQAAKDAADEGLRVAKERKVAAERAAQATARLDAEAAAMAKERAPRFSDKSTPQKIAGILAAIIGGLVQARVGGRNQGLDMINSTIEQEVDAWKAEQAGRRELLGQRRGAVAERLRSDNEIADAADGYRLSLLKRVEFQLQQERDQYDPKGTRAIALSNDLLQIQADQARAKEAHGDKMFKRELEIFDRDLAARKHDEEVRKNKAAEAAKAAKAGAGAGPGPGPGGEDVVQPPDYFKQRGLEPPPVPMSPKEYRSWLPQAKQSRDLSEPGTKLKREQGLRGLSNSDGEPPIAATPKAAEELQEERVALDSIAKFVGDISRGIEEHGGESDYFKSKAWQQTKSSYAFIVPMLSKGLGLGTLDEGTVKHTANMLGGADPTSFWHDAAPGLKRAVDNLTVRYNNGLKQRSNYDGKAYVPEVAAGLSKPKVTPEDAAFNDVLLDPNKMSSQRTYRDLGIPLGYDPEFASKYGSNTGSAFQSRLYEEGGMLPSQRRTLDGLAATAASNPAKRADMLDKLDKAARDAAAPSVRDYARALFVRASSTPVQPDAVSGGQ